MNMGHGLPTDDPTVTAAFRTAVAHQFLLIVFLAAGLAIAWNTIRTVRFRRAAAAGTTDAPAPPGWEHPESPARRLLRIAFGLLWILDGLLQAQSSMPLGLTGGVITPAASSSPGWVQHLVGSGAAIWNDHPVTAAASAIWIQVGIGLFLLVAPRGRWSRAAGLASAGWGLVVWSFGEAFGGIFGRGSSWLFGSPGAAVFYVVAGALVALPDHVWETDRIGRALVRATGVFFVGMGVLQAWPGRGFWSGRPGPGGTGATLAAMESQMSQLRQPSVTASWVRTFGSFDVRYGWLVNAVVVVALVGIGACFLTARPSVVRAGVIAGSVLCLADWVLVQDFGFLGGLGTDPNSMLPMIVVFTSGYLALVRLPVRAAAPAAAPAAASAAAPAAAPVDPAPALADRVLVRPTSRTGESEGAVPDSPVGIAPGVPATLAMPTTPAAREARATPGQWLVSLPPSYLLRSIAALGAVAVILVGAAPLALAAVDSSAGPIVHPASSGPPNAFDPPAPGLTLGDRSGTPVSLQSVAGRAVVLTFLDPTCTSDCPPAARGRRVVDRRPGADAVDAAPWTVSPAHTAA